MPKILSASLSDQGRRRSNNEDFVTFFEPIDPKERQANGCLYIVADGIGGASSRGERASEYAAKKVLYDYFQPSNLKPIERLREAIQHVNKDIFNYTEESKHVPRMATTMVAAVIRDNTLLVINVGDSRAYLIRNGKAMQITRDHSIIGEMLANGELTEEEALHSRIKNRLTRSIGGEAEVHVQVYDPIVLQAGDKILLCTDGLTRYALSQKIAELTAGGAPDEISQRLVRYANEHGGADNVSVILVLYEAGPDSPNVFPPPMYSHPLLEINNNADVAAIPSRRGSLDLDEDETELGRARIESEDATELEIPTTGPIGILWVTSGFRRGKYYPIRNGTIIGRRDGDLILDDPKVSGSHAKFTMEGNQFIIWDLGSSSGTYVNGKRIRERTLLTENNLIKIGNTTFVIKLLTQKANTELIKRSENRESIQEKEHFRISVSYPLCLAKRFASILIFHFYLPEYHADVQRSVRSEFKDYGSSETVDYASSVRIRQKVKIKLSNPNFSFSDSGIKIVDDSINKITFLVQPNDNCEPGSHKILVSIVDADADYELESITINVQVVDFAFDHVSRPLLSKAFAIVLGVGSFAMFILTFLEQIDKTFGLTYGTAAGVLALAIYVNFYNLYQRIRPNTP